jgi:DNA-nicking Smr family endonuclease
VRTVSKADRELFRRAVGDVQRLRPAKDRPEPVRTRPRDASPPPQRTTSTLAPRKDPESLSGERRSSGLRKSELRALLRGRVRVEAALDLHGLTVEAARRRLQQFLDEALSEGLRCVRIVHGKGLRSGPAGPVLKSLVHAVLRSVEDVAAFNNAPPRDGGSGATIVLLRSGRPRPAR